MVTHFIATAKIERGTKKVLKIMLERWDIHDWIIGKEKGKKGYEHFQIRGSLSGNFDDFFKWHHQNGYGWHIEKSNTGPFESNYERKEGHYWSSYDTVDVRKVRFGSPNTRQKHILRWLESQSDREIDVWLDPSGNHGKSWLAIHLWETGKALVIPRAASTPERLSAFVCSAWKGEGIIIIDIPRAQKIDPKLYETIEELKDGLVFDHRYYGKTRNVRGTKILIFTNTPLDVKKLSKDRWRLHGFTDMPSVQSIKRNRIRNGIQGHIQESAMVRMLQTYIPVLYNEVHRTTENTRPMDTRARGGAPYRNTSGAPPL